MKSKRIITALSAGVALTVATGCSRADTQGPTVNPPVPEAAAGAAGPAQEAVEEEAAEEEAAEEAAEEEAAEEEAAKEVAVPERPKAPPEPIYTNPLRGRPQGGDKSSE